MKVFYLRNVMKKRARLPLKSVTHPPAGQGLLEFKVYIMISFNFYKAPFETKINPFILLRI